MRALIVVTCIAVLALAIHYFWAQFSQPSRESRIAELHKMAGVRVGERQKVEAYCNAAFNHKAQEGHVVLVRKLCSDLGYK